MILKNLKAKIGEEARKELAKTSMGIFTYSPRERQKSEDSVSKQSSPKLRL